MIDPALFSEFYLAPLLTAMAYAATVPVVGGAVFLRNEILLGLVLPAFGAAVLALAALAGAPPDHGLAVHGIVAAALFLLLSIPALRSDADLAAHPRRELFLAGIFVASQTVAYLALHLSPRVQAGLSNRLHGEMLSAGWTTFAVALVLSLAILFAAVGWRGRFYGHLLDETLSRATGGRHRFVAAVYRALVAVTVTSAVVVIGPLAATALLVFPAMFGRKAASGMDGFFLSVIGIGLLGTLGGFLGSIAWDLPPAHGLSAALPLAGWLAARAKIVTNRFRKARRS
jgi:ABC-type Mn2+/Zn2+ transport system permease subunit